jgi:glycosyltransferase involved in cell wall biosynthesis
MNGLPTISIITVCYNSAATLPDTIRSVVAQVGMSIQHILVDGGSTDGSIALIEGYAREHKHVVWVSEKDQGLYDAMNKGLSLCTGVVIGLLNADDFYCRTDALKLVAEKFAHENPDALYADLNYVDAGHADRIIRRWKSGIYKPNSFLWGWMPPHPTFFVRKEVYNQYGGFRLDMGSAADYELMLRFIHKNQIQLSYLPQTIIHMRAGGVSNKQLKNRMRANEMDNKAWEVNGLKPYFFTRWLKPLRKIKQFL